MADRVKAFANAVVGAALLLTFTLGAGFVAHGLWLVFLYGWETIPR